MTKVKIVIPNWVRESAVSHCKSVEEFAYKYYRQDRFIQRGKTYVEAVLESMNQDIQEKGYACISHHDNIVGKFITYIDGLIKNPISPPLVGGDEGEGDVST